MGRSNAQRKPPEQSHSLTPKPAAKSEEVLHVDRKAIDAYFAEDYAAWISNPVNADAVELRRLEQIAKNYNDFGNPEREKLRELSSFLFERPNWKSLVDRLFSFDTPIIHIGGGFSFQKCPDHMGEDQGIKFDFPGQGRKSVFNIEVTDTGMISMAGYSSLSEAVAGALYHGTASHLSHSWLHRPDYSVVDLFDIAAKRYRAFTKDSFSYFPKETERFLKGRLQLRLSACFFNEDEMRKEKDGGNARAYDQKGVRNIDVPLDKVRPIHLVPLPGELFHSFEMYGACAEISLGGRMIKFGSMHGAHEDKVKYYPGGIRPGFEGYEWGEKNHTLAVSSKSGFAGHPIVTKLTADLFKDTTIFSHPNYAHMSADVSRLIVGEKPAQTPKLEDSKVIDI